MTITKSGFRSRENKARMKVDRAIQKRHAWRTTHIHTVRLAVRHSAHGVQSSAAAGCCCRHGEGRDWLCCMVRPEADWTRRQLDKKRIHDKRPVSCCFLARWWDNLGGAGRSGEGVGLRQGHRRKKRREYGKCSVPQGPVATGYGVRDVQEGWAHHIEGFVREGWHVLWRHPLCLDLWKDLQSDGPRFELLLFP